VLKSLRAVNYSARDIIYRPRNVRVHWVYGYSPVLQVLMTINIALRRQRWQLVCLAATVGVPLPAPDTESLTSPGIAPGLTMK
jgi:hypothetical protein